MRSKAKTTAAAEEARPVLVPKLRFPEFREAGHWEERTMGSIGSLASGGTPSKDNPDYWNGSIPWVSASSMYDLVVEKADHYVTPLAIGKGTRIAKKGSILILVRGSMLFNRVPICIAGIDVAFNQDVKALDVDASIDTRFLLYQLSAFQSLFPINETGIGAGKIELDHLKGFQLFIPKLAEQQKIAEYLSLVDELIAAQTRKVDALKTHKKGLMQQLFPREGETQPRLRFTEFQNAGDWELTNIGALGNFYYGKSAPKWSLEKDAPTPCVRYGELYTKFGPVIAKTFSRTNIPRGKLRFSKGGEILIPRVGEKPEDFGKYCSYLPLKGIAIGEMISVLETKQDALFYTYYFRNMYRQFAKVVEGQNVKNLYYTELEPLPISCPTIPEQHRIAACLSSLDALITNETQKHDALKTHKKGLMQQLFPCPEEAEA